MTDYFLQSHARSGEAVAVTEALYAVFAAKSLPIISGNLHYVYRSTCRAPQAGCVSVLEMTEIQPEICLHKILQENNYVQLLTLSTELSTSKITGYYAA